MKFNRENLKAELVYIQACHGNVTCQPHYQDKKNEILTLLLPILSPIHTNG